VVFTGGTSGLGYTALRELVSQPQIDSKEDTYYHIILGSRAPLTTAFLWNLLGPRASDQTTVEHVPLELTSLPSIHHFAARVLSDLTHPLDTLVLCAGAVIQGQRRMVALPGGQGEVEETMMVNTISQALLVRLLLPKMNKEGGRIVFVGSNLHIKASHETPVTPQTLDYRLGPDSWHGTQAYAISKLVQMHLAFIVCEEIDSIATTDARNALPPHRPTVVVVSPGFVPETGLAREWPWYARFGMKYIAKWLPSATSLRVGGQTIVRGMQMQLPDASSPSESVKGTVTYISKRGIEKPALECEDLGRRREWAVWFAELGVW